MADIGTSYLQIVPSMQGAVKSIQSTLSGIDLGGASKKMGASLSAALPSSLSKSVSKAMDNAATAAKKPLEAALKGVTSAEADLAKAQNNRQKIVDQIAKSEQKLSDLSAMGKENTKAYEQAQSRLADQQNKLAKASFDVAGAQINLESAQANVAKVSGEVDAAIAKQQTGWGKLAISAPAVSEAFKATGSALQSVGKNLNEVGGKLTKSITMPAVGAATAVGGLVTALGFKRLTGIENATQALKGLGYSAEEAAKIMDGPVLDAVKGTAFGIADAGAAASGFLAGGMNDLDELSRYLKLTGDMAATGTAEYGHMAQMLQRIAAEGRVTGGDLTQMSQNGVYAAAALSDSLGISQEEVRKLASEGKISADQLADALENQIGGSALAMGETLEGALANTKAAIGRLGEKIWGDVYPKIKDTLDEFMVMLDSPEWGAAASAIGEAISEAFDRVVNAVRGAIDWWNALSPETQKMIGKFALVAVAAGPVLQIFGKITTVAGSVMNGLGGIAGAVGKIAPKFAAAGGGAGGFLKVIGRFAGPIGIAIAAIAALWKNSESFRDAVTTLGQTLWDALKQIIDAVKPAFETMMDVFGTVASMVGDLIGQILEAAMPLVDWIIATLVPIIQSIVEHVTNVFNAIMPVVENAMTFIQAIIDTVMAVLSGDWSAAWEGIQSVFSAAWELIKSILSAAWEIIKSVFTTALDIIQGVWESVWGSISDFVSGVWENIKTAVSTAIENVRATIDRVVGTIKSAWDTAWTAVKTKFTDIWEGIKRGAKEGVDKVYDTVKGIKDKITGFFSGAGSWLVDSGKKIIGGLVDGINSMVSKVTDAVGSVLSAARNLLPFSPAKEGPFSGKGWTLYSGQSIVEALAQGVTQKSSLFEGAVADLMAGGSAALGSGALGSAYVRGIPVGVGGAVASAGGAGSGATYNFTINNPLDEPSSTTVRKGLQMVGAGVNGLG